MFNVGGGELLAILLLALIVLGPDKLPHAAKQAGKYLSEFRRISSGFQDEIRNAMDLEGLTSTPPKRTTPETRAAAVDTDLVPDPDAPPRPEPADVAARDAADAARDAAEAAVVADADVAALPEPGLGATEAAAHAADAVVRSPDAARPDGPIIDLDEVAPDVIVEGPSGSFS